MDCPAKYSNSAALGTVWNSSGHDTAKNVIFTLEIFTVWLPWPARAHTHVGALENILSAYAKDGKHWIHTWGCLDHGLRTSNDGIHQTKLKSFGQMWHSKQLWLYLFGYLGYFSTSLSAFLAHLAQKYLQLGLSTTSLRQWGFRQCLSFSWTTLRGKHCRHPIAVIVDMLRLSTHNKSYW